MRVLTVNTGSSSIKLRLLDADDAVLAERELASSGTDVEPGALRAELDRLGEADAVAHRIVHGGPRAKATRLDDAERRRWPSSPRSRRCTSPRRSPRSPRSRNGGPTLPAVGCYDTAFHASLPAAAATYAVPADWRKRFGLRRYGFHGLSHAYVARRSAELLGATPARLVSCHLGAGASLAAVRDGRSVDTTMGFTPLEGLVMATRSGSVDPGLVLWLVRQGIAAEEVHDALEHRSGLLALAGTADMRDLLTRDDAAAQVALDVYLHRLAASVAAMAAALGGLDALAFTGGVGEHAPEIRRRAADRLAFLGVGVDEEANAAARGDAELTAAGAGVRVLVLAAREDAEMARQARALVGRAPPASP